jgi:hypothetical protein
VSQQIWALNREKGALEAFLDEVSPPAAGAGHARFLANLRDNARGRLPSTDKGERARCAMLT